METSPNKCHLRPSDIPTTRRLDNETNTLWVPLKSVNPHIICGLCQGYLYEACTITECMHSFCKSCIVKHLLKSLNCPMCAILIHPTDPFVHIRFDGLLQDIVYALLPHLEKEEIRKEHDFYEERETETGGKKAKEKKADPEPKEQTVVHPSPAYKPMHPMHIPTVSLCLQCIDPENRQYEMEKPYLRVSGGATIKSVSTFLKRKLQVEDSLQVDLYCPGRSGFVCLGNSHTLKAVKDLYCFQKDIIHLKYDVREQ